MLAVKDLINIQDYLLTRDDVGDWEGEEELIADKINDLLHYCWHLIPDDMDAELIEEILTGIWDNLRGDMVLLDTELDELRDWVETHVRTVEDSKN